MILLLPTVHHVLAAEKRLLAHGIACALIPTPQELSRECGMSLEVDVADLPVICAALAELRFETAD